MDFADRREKNQRKQTYWQAVRPRQKTKKVVEHEGNGNTNYNWRTWNGSQRFGMETRSVENQRTNCDDLDYNIVKIG